MNHDITIQELIQYFEDRVHQIDRGRIGNNAGKVPFFPMLVVFVGGDAADSYQMLSSRLFQLWPQYRDELQFMSVSERKGGTEYRSLSFKDNQLKQEDIPQEQVGEQVSTLFGEKSHYRNLSKLLVYYVLDTTQMNDRADFQESMQTIAKVRESLGVNDSDMMDMLFLLLNEKTKEHRAAAADIKDILYQCTEQYGMPVFLLSNRRSDNVILEDWEQCHKIMADVIAVTNNDDTDITRSVFEKRVYTASYACEEKPSHQIGQILVNELIDGLPDEKMHVTRNPIIQEKNFAERLGLSQEMTIRVLDRYAEQELYQLLPDEKELMLFPRGDSSERNDMASLSEREFNDLTMCAWSNYLNQIVSQVQERMEKDTSMRTGWKTEYRQMLSEHFSAGELIWMKEHLEDIRKVMGDARQPSLDMKVLSAAKTRLRYMLSANPALIDIFIGVIKELGKNAETFRERWGQLLQSRLTLHAVRDGNISNFYKRKVRQFFNSNEQNIAAEFEKIWNMDELRTFLTGSIDRMLDSDPIFSESFEVELEARLQAEEQPQDAKQYIRRKLTGDDVPLYFQKKFSLGVPIVSAILLNVGTSLYQNLVGSLPDATYYYHTGSGNAAEALKIYKIGNDNLTKG